MSSISDWARVVLDVAASTPTGRYFGERIFIAELFAEGNRRGLSEFARGLEEFKKQLLVANQKQLLSLHRADLTGAMDRDLSRESEIRHPLGAVFHFVESNINPGLQHTMKRGPLPVEVSKGEQKLLFDPASTSTPAAGEILVTYRPGQGILLRGETYAHRKAIGEGTGFRWIESKKHWAVRGTKKRLLDRPTVEAAAAKLRAKLQARGLTVRVEYSDAAAPAVPTAPRARRSSAKVRAPQQSRRGPVPISSVDEADAPRRECGLEEVDRVLGGGLVDGTVLLLSGEPGAGKSTMLVQVAHGLARSQGPVLYATAEEMPAQVAARATRLKAKHPRLYLMAEDSIDDVLEAARKMSPRPAAVIVDSIQKMRRPHLRGPAGGIAQVRAVSAEIGEFAHGTGVAVIIVCHVEKGGRIAGPKTLEHDVDATLILGLEADGTRVLRAKKNRFGATHEVGRFVMTNDGLVPKLLRPGTKAQTSGQYRRDDGPEVTVVKGEPLPPTPAPGGSYTLADATRSKPESTTPTPRARKRPPPRPGAAKAKAAPPSVARPRLTATQRRQALRAKRLECSAASATAEAASIDIDPYRVRLGACRASIEAAEMAAASLVLALKAARALVLPRGASMRERAAHRKALGRIRCDLRVAEGTVRQARREQRAAKTELAKALLRHRKRQHVAEKRRAMAARATRS